MARFALAGAPGVSVIAEAADGAQALALVAAHRPDCVVLDVDMPVMGGFEALAELRLRHPSVPVVMLSGFTDESSVARAMKAGAAAYVEKSGQLIDLAAAVQAVAASVDLPSSAAEDPDPRRGIAIHRPAGTSAGIPTDVPIGRLPSAEADLQRFEYVVSHDLAEPLRSVTGFATLLRSRYAEALDGPGLLFLDHLAAGAERMNAMLEDLLAYSRAGRTQSYLETVNLNEVASNVLSSLQPRVDELGAFVTAGDLPAVIGDRVMLTTVLRHVVVNGLTFNASTPRAVRIDGRTDRSTAVITVTDNGIGVDPARHEVVFGLFGRLNARDQYPGTGAGLALCQRLLGLQGGLVEIDTSTSKGTAFRLLLPLPDQNSGVAQ